MAPTLEQRMDEVEKKLAQLISQLAMPKAHGWEQTFGLSRDDAGFEEMCELGRDYRRSLRDQS